MNLKKLREGVLVFMAHKMGLPYFRLIRKKPSFPYTKEQLAAMPEGSVGKTMYVFFQKNNLDLLPYYEKHDIKHVVLGYEADEEGEVCLQCFMLANGRMTIPVWIAVGYGVVTMPEYWAAFYKAWIRGRRNKSLQQTDWFALIPQPLYEVQHALLRVS
ncbi:hypothetical protein DBR32_13540 [Taibaiella sp. KBW10]|uniref:hypothetical protein n=1 Tax=Taibaiella sp. KBW10 TaxID=2153357 RepID=UPI000F595C85|nr:hypothetical protein [Taibaiella sp. KBW10]RQO30575.1 hypothetical protein DBR32_13540 [Taibaiella sp. KBW10]